MRKVGVQRAIVRERDAVAAGCRSRGASVRRCTPSSPWIPIVRRDPDGERGLARKAPPP